MFKTTTRRLSALLVALALLTAGPAFALPDVEAGPAKLRFSGYVKSLSSMTQGAGYLNALGLTDRETLFNNASRVRLRSQTLLADVAELTANYEIFGLYGDDQRLRREAENVFGGSPTGRMILDELFPEVQPPELFGFDHRLDETDEYRLDHRLDRLYLRLHVGPWDFTLGRQALSWGPGRLWNPTDYLASFSPTEIDKEEKRGVDLGNVRVALHDRVAVEAYAAPVREGDDHIGTEQSAAAGRLTVQAWDAEFALSAGNLYDRNKVGFSVDGLIGEAGVRGAITRTQCENPATEPYYQAIVNFDYGWGVAWNPYLAAEYFHNGLGKSDPDDYTKLYNDPGFVAAYQRGELYNVGRHYAGVILSVQPHALVAVGETAIFNITDQSGFNSLAVTWSVVQNLDLQLGAQNTFGPIPSEFGGVEFQWQGNNKILVPDNYFAYVKYYF